MRDDGEAGPVVGVVLDRRRDDEEAVLARRPLARQAGERAVDAGHARAFGVARDRPALGARQMVAEPGMALRQRLRMRADGDDAVERVDLSQQVVADVEAGLADDGERRRQEEIERARDHAFARVLDRHDAEVGGACARRVEDLVGVGAGDLDDRRAEVAERGELAEGAGRAEVGDARRRLEGAARRHDLAPDRRHAGLGQRPAVGLLERVDHRRLALGAKRRRAFGALQGADRRARPRARRLSRSSSSRSSASICRRSDSRSAAAGGESEAIERSVRATCRRDATPRRSRPAPGPAAARRG